MAKCTIILDLEIPKGFTVTSEQLSDWLKHEMGECDSLQGDNPFGYRGTNGLIVTVVDVKVDQQR